MTRKIEFRISLQKRSCIYPFFSDPPFLAFRVTTKEPPHPTGKEGQGLGVVLPTFRRSRGCSCVVVLHDLLTTDELD